MVLDLIAVALAVALGLGVLWYYIGAVAQFHRNRRSIASAYGQHAAESRANLDRDNDRRARSGIHGESGKRSIQRADYWRGSGRHAADGDPVLESETAVA